MTTCRRSASVRNVLSVHRASASPPGPLARRDRYDGPAMPRSGALRPPGALRAPATRQRPADDVSGRAVAAPWRVLHEIDLAVFVGELKAVMVDGILTTHASPHPTTVFDGSYDWHSCVHAHWALLSLAHRSHDRALEDWLLARLTPATLQTLADMLAQPRYAEFELPYGQAWLLLLLGELATSQPSASMASALLRLRAETEARLLRWLRTTPFPEEVVPATDPEGMAEGLRADHGSWLFALCLLKLSCSLTPRRCPALDAAVTELVAARLTPAVRQAILAYAHGPRDFVFLPAALALLLAELGEDDAAASPSITLPPWPAPIRDANAHAAGAAVMRLWPYARRAAAGDEAARTRMMQGLRELDASAAGRAMWAGDFDTVGHWVPQFVWMIFCLAGWVARGVTPPLPPAARPRHRARDHGYSRRS